MCSRINNITTASKLNLQAMGLASMADSLAAVGLDNITVNDARDRATCLRGKGLDQQAKGVADIADDWAAMGSDNITVNDARERAARLRANGRDLKQPRKRI